jgi:rhodanese-related sulfurtransferase
MVSACCLCLSVSLPAQTGSPAVGHAGRGAYFQALVKEAKTRVREIGADQLGVLQKADPSSVLVDVREDNEWDKSRIPGAIHVGRGVLEVNIESRVPQKATPIVVYCQGGGRSAVAADVLTKMGYTNVTSLAGGMAAYLAAGLPVDKLSPPK